MPESDDPNKPKSSGDPEVSDTSADAGTPTEPTPREEPGERFPNAGTRPASPRRPTSTRGGKKSPTGIDRYLPSRKSKFVAAGVVTALVGTGVYAIAQAAGDDDKKASDRRCVDNNNVVVDDSQCNSGGGGHYYYGGFGGFAAGSLARGGSATPTRNDTVTRGGLGNSSSAKGTTSSGS